MSEQKAVICPYCGDAQPLAERCRACGGLFEPLSRQATHNAMGPWFVRDSDRPFQPGCSFETLLRLIERGRVGKFTIVRGPTTRQFWTIAKHVPGLSHLLGFCHQCDASVDAGDHSCHACGASFATYVDRNYLGLPEIRPLPWETNASQPIRSSSPMWRNEGDGNEPRTISSFVSDDELLGTSESAGGPLPPSFGGGSVDTALAQERVATLPVHRHEQRVGDRRAGQRSLQSVAKRQKLTIRILIASVAFLVLIVLMLSFAWPGSNQATDRQGDSQAVPNGAQGVEVGEGPLLSEVASGQDVYDLLAGYERAIGLMDAASDDHRVLSERIADYESALRLLIAAKSGIEPALQPADLNERIESVRVQLDRLRLREFFP